eukprot:COSAG01_NODE_29623_length_633_cov_1.423221_2_plen_94_part_00
MVAVYQRVPTVLAPTATQSLMSDRPGLQVIGAEGRWIDAPVTCRNAPGDYSVPVIPGSVIVNTGGTLMHLSRGRCVCALAQMMSCRRAPNRQL